MIIGFGGQMMAAKDVCSDYLVMRFHSGNDKVFEGDWKRVAFADSLKDVYMQSFGVDRNFIEKWKREPEPPPTFTKTVREALQMIGDGFRQIQPTVWIDTLFRNAKGYNICVSDARYKDEALAIKKHGGKMVLLWRPGHENDSKHPSEAQYRDYLNTMKKRGTDGPITVKDMPFDFFLINDGTVQDLYDKLDNLLIPWLKESILAELDKA